MVSIDDEQFDSLDYILNSNNLVPIRMQDVQFYDLYPYTNELYDDIEDNSAKAIASCSYPESQLVLNDSCTYYFVTNYDSNKILLQSIIMPLFESFVDHMLYLGRDVGWASCCIDKDVPNDRSDYDRFETRWYYVCYSPKHKRIFCVGYKVQRHIILDKPVIYITFAQTLSLHALKKLVSSVGIDSINQNGLNLIMSDRR